MPLPDWAKAPRRSRPQAVAPPHDPLFRSVQEALHSAYAWEQRAAPKLSRVFADLLSTSRPLRPAHGMDPQELLAQAALTQRVARQSLTPLGWAAIEAYYIRAAPRGTPDPVARNARRRKTLALYVLYRAVLPRSSVPRRAHRFGLITAQVWSGLRLVGPTQMEWAGQYGVGQQTISQWTSGHPRRRMRPGLVRLLDAELAAAEGALAEPFQRVGLAP